MHPMLNIAVRAARRAGNVIVRGQQRLHQVKVESKGRHDYVSQVDRDAEAAILETLTDAYPHHRILAEESGTTEGDGGSAEFEWVVDPLDGTLNFLHGFPQYAVSIALRVNGRLDQAVVYDPTRDELFTASRGAGSQLNGRRIRVGRCHHLENALLATGFPVRRRAELDAYLRAFGALLGQCADVRRAGSAALDLAYVAAGRIDGFWEYGLSEWDVAAGALLVSEAGGLVGDPAGGETHVESGDIVAGNPKLFRQLLAALARGRRGAETPAAASGAARP